MRIDLHVHAKERSACSEASEEEMIQAAIDAGLDAIVFTDHTKLVPKKRLAELNNNEHLIVLGIHNKKLETTEWTYPELYKFCRKNGGFIAIAHPYRFSPEVHIEVEKHPPDALELCSANTPLKERNRIVEFASHLKIPKLSNSDAHKTCFVGKYYNILDYTPKNEKELIKILKQGKFTRAVIDGD